LDDNKRIDKNNNIKLSMQATLEKRSSQVCCVYKIKIDYSSLSKKQKEQLKMLFVEAKWLYNDILNYSKDSDIKSYDTKTNKINVLNKNKEIEQRELKFIGSQMKQSVHSNIISSIKTLSTLKKKDYKVGGLKFLSDYKSLNLKQYGNTYKFYDNKTMKIQGVKGKIRVSGMKQFFNIKGIEYANAKILNTPTGYYIAITTFRYKDDIEPKPFIGKEIGIDMGIKDHITLSNGEKFKSTIEETERLKRLQKKLFRQIKGSNNRRKTIKLIQREYQKISNKKNDIANKLVGYILSYENIYMQDEQISNWHKGLFSKQVQHSILGRVKSKLVKNNRVNVLDKMAPTTKFCPICHNINKDITLKDREYICPACNYHNDRDIHSANNMIVMVQILKNKKLVPTERRDVKPVENMNFIFYEAGRLQPSGCN
jgi:putative transposase